MAGMHMKTHSRIPIYLVDNDRFFPLKKAAVLKETHLKVTWKL